MLQTLEELCSSQDCEKQTVPTAYRQEVREHVSSLSDCPRFRTGRACSPTSMGMYSSPQRMSQAGQDYRAMTPQQLLQLLLGRAFWLNQVCQVLLVPGMGSLPKATPLPDGQL